MINAEISEFYRLLMGSAVPELPMVDKLIVGEVQS